MAIRELHQLLQELPISGPLSNSMGTRCTPTSVDRRSDHSRFTPSATKSLVSREWPNWNHV